MLVFLSEKGNVPAALPASQHITSAIAVHRLRTSREVSNVCRLLYWAKAALRAFVGSVRSLIALSYQEKL